MLLTQSAYARQRGCTPQYINQRVKAGHIPLVDGKIDPEIADAALARTADPARDPQVRAHAARRGHPLRPAATPVQPEEPAGAPPMDTGRYIETPMSRAKAADAIYSAKTKQLEYERAIGKLVEAAEVSRAVADVATSVRQFDGIPDRLASRLAAETDARKVHALLAAEIASCRQAVADFCAALSERLTAKTQ